MWPITYLRRFGPEQSKQKTVQFSVLCRQVEVAVLYRLFGSAPLIISTVSYLRKSSRTHFISGALAPAVSAAWSHHLCPRFGKLFYRKSLLLRGARSLLAREITMLVFQTSSLRSRCLNRQHSIREIDYLITLQET